MNSREKEMQLLEVCVKAARNPDILAKNKMEANLFQLAGMVLASQLPVESKNLMNASDSYFMENPLDKMTPLEVLHTGWFMSFPRLRNMLTAALLYETTNDQSNTSK